MPLIKLQSSLRGDLAARWPEWSAGDERRAIAARKKLIYAGNHLPLVISQIRQKILDLDMRRQVEVFASRSPNLLKAVTDAVAVVYTRGCRRSLRGVSEETAKAFSTIVAESQINKRANHINALSWVQGPVCLTPFVDKRNRLALDIVTPDAIELRRAGEYVEAALWRYEGSYIELDAEAYRYYDSAGKLYQEIPHGTGECPAVPFVSVDNSTDFWTPGHTLGLADNTLNIAYKLAYGMWVRQVSGNFLTVLNGEVENVPPGQSTGDISGAVHLNAPEAQAKISVHNRIVPARDHLEEIAALMAMTISEFGIPPGSIGMTANSSFDLGTIAISVEGDRLGVLRDKQVPHLLASEQEFWPLVCDYLNSSSHKLAGKLPPSDEVREMLRIDYPDLASAKDQLARIEALKAGLPLGLTSPRAFLAASRPERTDAEIEEEQHENLDIYINLIEPLTTRQTPKEAPKAEGYQTIAQEQGREGGIASGEARAMS